MDYGFPDIIASATKEKENIESSNRISNIPVDVSKSDSNDLKKKQTKENFMDYLDTDTSRKGFTIEQIKIITSK